MHIVQAFPSYIPPVAYGGISRVVFWLAREFVKRGHTVSVLARPESTVESDVPGTRLIAWPEDCDDYRPLLPSDADIVHFHRPLAADRLPEIPFVVTEHGNKRGGQKYPPNTVFVSRTHARNHGSEHFVYNGIPLDEFALQETKDDYILFMALLKMRSKNAKTLAHLAMDSGVHAKFAGGDLWDTKRIRGYWKWRARKHPGLLESLGLVHGEQKVRLIQNAKMLFYVVNLQEPFALACHEALACGTPVIGSPHGALPEYLRDGENGYIVKNYKEALAAVKRIAAMGPDETAEWAQRCRDSAFGMDRCGDGYLECYEKVIESRWLYPPKEAEKLKYRRKFAKKIRYWLP